MRKFLMAVALLAVPAVLSAQSANATINARVYKALTITATQGTLDMGIAIQGAGTTLTVLPTAAGAAAFAINGQAATAITVTEPASTTLTGGGATLTFNAQWAHGATSTQASQTAGSISAATLNATGDYYLWLGGSVNTTAVTAAQTGTYTGTITVSVAY